MAVCREVWLVNFGPFIFDGGEASLTVGGEMDKFRPAAVLNADGYTHYSLRIVVPLTSVWKLFYADAEMVKAYIPVPRTPANGLTADSWAVTPQIKSVASERFVRKLGVLSTDELERIMAGILRCLGLVGS